MVCPTLCIYLFIVCECVKSTEAHPCWTCKVKKKEKGVWSRATWWKARLQSAFMHGCLVPKAARGGAIAIAFYTTWVFLHVTRACAWLEQYCHPTVVRRAPAAGVTPCCTSEREQRNVQAGAYLQNNFLIVTCARTVWKLSFVHT